MWQKSGSGHRPARPARRGLARGKWQQWLLIVPLLPLSFLGPQLRLPPPGLSLGRAQVGEWTAPFNVGVKGIHSDVLPGGKVLLWSYPVGTAGSSAVLLNPSTKTFTDVSMSYRQDAFCSGNDLLPNGEVFVTGGHVYNGTNPAAHEDGKGIKNTAIFDPATQTWTPGPPMAQARWYPTNLELGNGRILIFAGQVDPRHDVRHVDEYDPSSNTMKTLPATADKELPEYPRMTLLPDGNVFYDAPSKGTQMFHPATNTWTWVGNTQFGHSRAEASSILLPGLKKILIVGGRNRVTGPTNTAEIIDFSKAKPTWHYTGSMTYARAYANGVLLADGTVLEVGGGTGTAYKEPVYRAELYNPRTGTWSTMAAQTAPRIYHSTAVLLPSGQVLSAGTDSGTYQYTAEIYSPPYLFRGPRPKVSSAPASVGYGQSFAVSVPGARSITRVALVKPSGATHALGQDQRYVDLSFTHVSSSRLSVTSPPDGNHAPPGWYMLFVLNSRGVPSVARWVQVR